MIEIFEAIDTFNDIVFDDASHTYHIGGQKAISVTTLIGKYEEEFDEEGHSRRIAKKRGVSQQAILDEWAYKRDFSTIKGSATHDYTENRLANKVYTYDPTESINRFGEPDIIETPFKLCTNLVEKFVSDIRGKMIPIKSELVVGDAELLICGMIDQIFYNRKSGMLEIWDWKTNGEFTTDSKYMMLNPLSHISTSKLDVYSIQLHLYKYILEKNTSLRFGPCYLTWFNENNPNYKIYQCKDYSNEVKLMIDHYVNSKK